MPATWMTSRRDEYDVDEKRMPAAWIDVNEDGSEATGGGKDDSKYDAA